MGNQPSIPRPGTKFRVIGPGMSRTGTKTFRDALEILLDGPPHDSSIQSLGGSAQEQKLWLEIMELAPRVKTLPEQKKLDYLISDVLDGYTSTMDMPAVLLTEEIMRVYPDAIVIATTRDSKSWNKSRARMREMSEKWYIPFVVYWMPKVNIFPTWQKLVRRMTIWRFGYEDFEEKTLGEHEAHLRKVVPPEKLFWFKPSDGWEPLCKILDVPVPDRPFPHSNKAENADKVFRRFVTAGVLMWAGVVTVLICASWLAWKFLW